jgi:hypothetical protein
MVRSTNTEAKGVGLKRYIPMILFAPIVTALAVEAFKGHAAPTALGIAIGAGMLAMGVLLGMLLYP